MKHKKAFASILPSQEKASQDIQSTVELERILRNAGVIGILERSSHFTMRRAQWKFTTVEHLHILRRGVRQGAP